MKLSAVVLAAGLGKRMKSDLPKVMHLVLGTPMVKIETDMLRSLGIDDIVLIVGHKKEILQEYFKNTVSYAFQDRQLGTGHAVKCVFNQNVELEDNTIILCGDTPLLDEDTLSKILDEYVNNKLDACVVSMVMDNPFGYGRIKKIDGNVSEIIEEKDADEKNKLIKEVNTGIYILKTKILKKAINLIDNNNAQNEYYLTDIIKIINEEFKLKVKSIKANKNEKFMGINNRRQLAKAECIMLNELIDKHMENGVRIIRPETVYIEKDVIIAPDVVLYPGTILKGNTRIGKSTQIIGGYIENSEIGANCTIKSSYVIDSFVKDNVTIGPFANLRQGAFVEDNCRIGNFVEIKKSHLHSGVKSAHLTYLGDSELGENTNIGAGTITCNYDGKNKFKTKMGKNVFIGSNSALVAPVEIGDNAYIGAGSTITKDVPAWSLAVGRGRQVTKENWVKKKKEQENAK